MKNESDDDTGSSSDSSVENYLKPAHEIKLDSSFFKFEKIDNEQNSEKNKSSLKVNRLSDSESSESENEIKHEIPVEEDEKTFETLENYHKKIEEARLAVENYKNKKMKQEKTDIKKLLSVGETKVVNTEESGFMSESSDEEMDWEDVESKKALSQATKKIPKEGVQITVEIPTLIRKKKQKDDYFMQVKRRMNRIKKENQVYMHKVHLLCWIAHGNYVNTTLNSEKLLGVSLSLIPSENCYPPERADLSYLEQITSWYRKIIKVVEKTSDRVPTISLERILQTQFSKKVANSNKNFVLMFICILRALGLQCRLILSLRCLPLKPPASELCSLSTKNNENEASTSSKNDNKKLTDKNKVSKSYSKDKHNSTSKEDKNVINEKKAALGAKKENNIDQEKTNKSSKEKLNERDNKKKSSKTKHENKKLEENALKIDDNKVKSIVETKSEKEDSKDKKSNRKCTRIDNCKEKNKECDSKKVDIKENQEKAKRQTAEKRNENSNIKKDEDKSTEKENTKRNLRRKAAEKIENKEKNKSDPKTRKSTSEKETKSRQSLKLANKVKYNSDDEFKPDRRSSSSSPIKKNAPKNDVRNDIINLLKGDMLQQKQVEKQKLVRRKKVKNDSDSDSDCMPEPEKKPRKNDSGDEFARKSTTKVKQRIKPRSEINKIVFSSEDEDDSKNEKEKSGNDVWIEVFLEAEEKWISVDVIKGQVHCVSELHVSLFYISLFVFYDLSN